MTWRTLIGLCALALALGPGCDRDDCSEAESRCGDRCVNLASDPAHCGACGHACAPGESCAGGTCQVVCPQGQSPCPEGCVDLTSSPRSCGACGTACAPGELCLDGRCEATCAPEEIRCGEACYDPTADRLHCGECDRACGPDELCVQGSCQLHCPENLTPCAGGCRDLKHDRDHCGACHNAKCPFGFACEQGECVPACVGFAPERCGNTCTNTQVDPRHCGACNQTCAAGQACVAGECLGEDKYEPPFELCGERCTLTAHDPLHCGACDHPCPAAANTVPGCIEGECGLGCLEGYGDCDSDLSMPDTNGCETHLLASARHCGACGAACPAPPNAAAACSEGTCGLGACQDGFGNCNGDAQDGCETNLRTNRYHCGACDAECPAGQSCVDGECQATGEDCDAPLALSPGRNTVRWRASECTHLSVAPACGGNAEPVGPDVVMSFTPSRKGIVRFNVTKPAGHRWHLVVTQECGKVSEDAPGYVCASATDNEFLFTPELPTENGRTWFVHLVDSNDGAMPLSNPLIVDVLGTEASDCTSVQTNVSSLEPAPGATVNTLSPTLSVSFDRPPHPTTGKVVLNGSLGTSAAVPLSTWGAAISADGYSLTLLLSTAFRPGEKVSVSWEGLVDAACHVPIAPPNDWTFTVSVEPCTPGMVGTSLTQFPTGMMEMNESFMAVDSAPDGYVYVGSNVGGANPPYHIYRMPKAGGPVENVYRLAGLSTAHVGNLMIIDGEDIYLVDGATAPANHVVFRISRNGGTTWSLENIAKLAPAAADDFQGGVAYGGRLYLLTNEASSTQATQIWSVDPKAPVLPATAVLERSFGASAYYSCVGLSMDAQSYYTLCRTHGGGTLWALVRINRTTGVVEELTRALSNAATTPPPASIHAVDHSGDGIADVVYAQTGRQDVHFVCLKGETAYADRLVTFRATQSSSNWGMAYDSSANALWVFDDQAVAFVKIQ